VTVDTTSSTPFQTVARLTFSGAGTTTGSLNDGVYTFKVLAAGVSDLGGLVLDGDNNGSAGGDFSFGFHRLFGDADGNATVNSIDFAAFRMFFGIAGPAFDYDGNGVVNSSDFAEFRKRFGTTLIP
jgi:hypothetical protein